MMTAFWYEDGIIHLEFIPDGETVNSDYHCKVLKMSTIILVIVAAGRNPESFLLHNAKATHSSQKIVKIDQLRWELISHPPYSNLAISDYAIFPHMKSFLRGRRFHTRKELEAEAHSVMRSIPPQWLQQNIRKLQERLQKCLLLDGDYVEKVTHPPQDERINAVFETFLRMDK